MSVLGWQDVTDFDMARAVDIAEEIIASWKKDKKKNVQEYVDSTFEAWKYDYALKMYEGEVKSGKVEISPLFHGLPRAPKNKSEEKTFAARFKKLKPWECTPLWVGRNPIDLLMHIWVNDYSVFDSIGFIDCLAYTAILAKDNPEWRWQVLLAGLRLADYRIEVLNSYKSELIKCIPDIKYKKNHLRGLGKKNKIKTEKKDKFYAEICVYATVLLNNKKPKSSIAGIISKNRKKNISTVQRALKTHISGLWK